MIARGCRDPRDIRYHIGYPRDVETEKALRLSTWVSASPSSACSTSRLHIVGVNERLSCAATYNDVAALADASLSRGIHPHHGPGGGRRCLRSGTESHHGE